MDVNAVIEKILADKERKIISGQEALEKLLIDVRRQIVAELAQTPGESYSAVMLRAHLASFEGHLAGFERQGSALLDGLVVEAWEGGAALVGDTIRAGGLGMAFGYTTGPVLQTLRDTSAYRIRDLSGDAMTKIRGELTLGVLGQKTPHQVMTAVAGSLDSPGVFKTIAERARVIVGVEMGRAFTQATQTSMEQASASLPELKKQWWHAGHPKHPRVSHLALHGQVQPVNKPFLIGLLVIDFPRSPKAPPSETIRCGCEMVPWHPNWGAKPGALPIYNQRGEEIARRGERTGNEEGLSGKFNIGQTGR